MATITRYEEYTEILIETNKGKNKVKQFGRFELVFNSFNDDSEVKSTLKSDTILMTIYTLKFASNLPSFEVVLGSAATNELPAIIELGGSQY